MLVDQVYGGEAARLLDYLGSAAKAMNRRLAIHAAGGLLVAAIAQSHAHAASFDVPDLMRLIAATTEVRASFTEEKHSSLLAAPIVSSGTLLYRRPDLVEKTIVSPRRERLRIVGQELTIERDGSERRVALASQPLLLGLAAGLRGVLSGDAALLGTHFRLKLEGHEGAWRLDLQPVDEALASHVESIVVSGRAGRVEQIGIRETNGDRSLMQVR